MSSFKLPYEISAVEAVRLIAQQQPTAAKLQPGSPKMTRPELVALARTACRTEGIKYEGFSKGVK